MLNRVYLYACMLAAWAAAYSAGALAAHASSLGVADAAGGR